MKVAAAVCFASALCVCSVAAAQVRRNSTLLEQAIENRLEVVYAGGGPIVTFDFNPDGTFVAVFPDRGAGRGDYVADRRYLCLIFREPPAEKPGENVRCERNSTEGRRLGQSWTVTDSHGDTVTLTVRPRTRP